MRYFLFVSLFLVSCAQPYKELTKAPEDLWFVSTLDFKPHFETELYRCTVDGKFAFKKFHLSGLLYFKNFSDTATRVIFQNEMGITYFDFEWDKQDSFQVNYIMEQMDKPALIKVLRKDFELLLFKNIDQKSAVLFNRARQGNAIRYNLTNGFAYYFSDENAALKSIENANERKKIVEITFDPSIKNQTLPENATIKHLRAHFSISLKKISQDAVE